MFLILSRHFHWTTSYFQTFSFLKVISLSLGTAHSISFQRIKPNFIYSHFFALSISIIPIESRYVFITRCNIERKKHKSHILSVQLNHPCSSHIIMLYSYLSLSRIGGKVALWPIPHVLHRPDWDLKIADSRDRGRKARQMTFEVCSWP